VLRISKQPEPVNLVHCPSCDRHEPFCYSRRHRPTPKNTLRGNPGCAVGPKTPTAWEAVMVMRVGADQVKEVNVQKLLKEFENIEFKERGSVEDFGMRITNLVANIKSLAKPLKILVLSKSFCV
jgi:hypothetical protein